MLKGHLPGTGRPAIYLLAGGNVVAMVFTPERHNLIQSQGNVSQTQTAGPSTKSPASARHEGQGREAPSVRWITPGCGGRGTACGVWGPARARAAGRHAAGTGGGAAGGAASLTGLPPRLLPDGVHGPGPRRTPPSTGAQRRGCGNSARYFCSMFLSLNLFQNELNTHIIEPPPAPPALLSGHGGGRGVGGGGKGMDKPGSLSRGVHTCPVALTAAACERALMWCLVGALRCPSHRHSITDAALTGTTTGQFCGCRRARPPRNTTGSGKSKSENDGDRMKTFYVKNHRNPM